MKLPFSLFLALRYLQPKRTFVSVITVLSVLGVVFGVWALVVVIAVMTGFDRELQRKVLGFDAHLILTNEQILRDWRDLDAEVSKAPGVVATAPFVQGPVIAEFNGRIVTPKIRGIEIGRELKIADLSTMIKAGTHELGSDQCLLGTELAHSLGAQLGDKVTIYAPRNIGDILGMIERVRKDPKDTTALDELKEVVLPAELEVVGIFESGRYTYDAEYILTPLFIGQELYGLGDDIHGLSVRTADPYGLAPIVAAIEPHLPLGTAVWSWMDLNKQFFDAVRMERNTMFVILTIIVVVAGFGIMNTLITVTVQKRREIGVLKALGAPPSQIVLVFFQQGIVVGIIGTLLGVGVGMITVQFRNEFKDWLARVLGIELFPPGIYQFSQIPAELVPQDIAIICASAFVICSIAALIPAWTAARLDPVKALRYE
ncbi:MAG: FtsX-like permease family protein [Chthoniobacteraceae bacterium]